MLQPQPWFGWQLAAVRLLGACSSSPSLSLTLSSASLGVSHGSLAASQAKVITFSYRGIPFGIIPNLRKLSGVCSALLVISCNRVVYWSRLGQAGEVQEQGCWESCPDDVGLRKKQISTALQLGLVLHGSSRAFPWETCMSGGCQLVYTFGGGLKVFSVSI